MLDQELRKAGLKVTLPRLKVLKILEGPALHHMSAENVYKALIEQGEDVSLATVYRVLTQFEEAGLVQRHNFEGGFSVFELNKGDHHHHIVCIGCGSVQEFVDSEIEKRKKIIALQFEFNVMHHNHTIYGHCRRCAEVK